MNRIKLAAWCVGALFVGASTIAGGTWAFREMLDAKADRDDLVIVAGKADYLIGARIERLYREMGHIRAQLRSRAMSAAEKEEARERIGSIEREIEALKRAKDAK